MLQQGRAASRAHATGGQCRTLALVPRRAPAGLQLAQRWTRGLQVGKRPAVGAGPLPAVEPTCPKALLTLHLPPPATSQLPSQQPLIYC
jgi:hypothetical protein